MADEKSTVTKADIVEKVYQKIGFSKKEASELVEMVFSQLKDTLCVGEKVKISGFGNFVVRQKKERVGRNPQTGDQIKISARRVLTFRPSQVLKAILNGEDVSLVKEDKTNISKVKAFLAAGGSDTPENIFNSIGIDVTEESFWQNGLNEISKDIDELESLIS